ncbi:MAG TPA: zinc ABC transporter substrate-binding protein [Methanospirillum sp.]|nr:zinc ABC transporter substrate-binding protein [Methanospirillum sp.]
MKKISYKLTEIICSSHRPHQITILRALFLLLFLLVLLCVSGCIEQKPASSSQSLIIACTIPPQEEFIRAVAGEYPVSVLVMVPPGASPHTFEPTPSQIAGLESADLYLALGSGMEFENRWLSRIQQQYPDLPVINMSKEIEIIQIDHPDTEGAEPEGHDAHEGTDPHVWLSLRNAARMVDTTAEAMVAVRPDMKDVFYKNRDSYIQNLTILDHGISTSLQGLKTRTILVYHPAFGYFCRDYNLTQMAVEENGREPSARQLASLITQARTDGIRIVFAEPEGSTRQAETLARELNGTMVLISPLAGNYLENMQHIAREMSGLS